MAQTQITRAFARLAIGLLAAAFVSRPPAHASPRLLESGDLPMPAAHAGADRTAAADLARGQAATQGAWRVESIDGAQCIDCLTNIDDWR